MGERSDKANAISAMKCLRGNCVYDTSLLRAAKVSRGGENYWPRRDIGDGRDEVNLCLGIGAQRSNTACKS